MSRLTRKLKDLLLYKILKKDRIAYFQTSIGNYYLPIDVSGDAIINEMKEGRIFEPEIIEIAKKFITKGSTVLDIGANLGQMTLLFSEMVGNKGKVYSFEADNYIHNILNKNIGANNRNNIISICKAVYDNDGSTMFYPIQDFERFAAYGSYGIDPKANKGRSVKTITIDSLDIQSPISFMKVDVQGSDIFAMRGAIKTINKHKMPIIFEYEEQFQNEFNTSFEDYSNFIESINYKIEDIINDINYLTLPN